MKIWEGEGLYKEGSLLKNMGTAYGGGKQVNPSTQWAKVARYGRIYLYSREVRVLSWSCFLRGPALPWSTFLGGKWK